MPVEVGVGYVSVVPETRGFGPELQRQITRPSADAGQAAGRESGSGFLGGIGGVLKAGIAGVAAGAGALFAVGFTEAAAQDKSNAKLGAQLGLTEKESARLGKVAGSVFGKGYGESIDQVNDSLRGLAQNGVAAVNAPKKDLVALTKSALNLAETFDADVGESAKAAGQLIKTGLAKDGKEAFDLITAGFQSGADKSGDLLDTLNEYGTQFRKAGLDGATSIGLISQALEAGARDGDIAADAIKEFSIRAIDGSDATADGFKILGLSSDTMATKFAKGGASAAAALDVTLDKLREIPDPVERNAAAVALFGTQSEDLGEALFAMDPSTAADKLGKVGGAAEKMGKTLHNTALQPFEVFKRQALQGLANAADKYALPAAARLGNALLTDVLPPIKTVGRVAVGVLVPAVRETGQAFSAGIGWLKEYGAWFIPVGVAVGGLTVLLSANAIATGVVTGVFSIYRGVLLAAAAVTRGYAVAQGVLNAVLTANPIGLIVVGIASLVALLVVAYNKSDTFRAIVQATWAGIQAGWSVLWNGYLQPGINGFMTGLRAVGTAASWLWGTVLSPVFGFIGTAAKVLFTAIVVIAILPTVAAFKVLGAVGSWLWDVALGPAFRGIGAAAMWLYNNAIKPAGSASVTIFKSLGTAGTWLWKNVLAPAFRGIGAVATWLYRNQIKPAVDGGIATLRALGAAGTWLWKNAIAPAFQGIGAAASWLYTHGVKPPIDRAKSLAKSLGTAFQTGANAVGEAFDSIKNKAKKPVAFIIDTVYNRGIRGVWNEVAGAFGAPKLDYFKGFARGGILPGQSSWRQGDSHLVPMRLGEGVAVSEAMRDPYERSRLLAVNQAAMRGQSLRPFQQEGFAKGGIFDWVKSTASKGVDLAKSGVSWLKDGIKASATAGLNRVVRPLIDKISGSASLYRDMVKGVPGKMISSILGYSGKADAELEKSGIGGRGFAAGLSWARTQHGKKYQWGGNGNPSWDCSGLTSAIESVVRGERPHRRWATGAFSGAQAPPGWVRNARSPYMVGITNSGVGHTAGTINGVDVESRGGDGVVIGRRARSYRDSMFTDVYGLKGYSRGGRPRPGEWAWTGENGPELIRFGGPSQVFDADESQRIAASQVGAGLIGALAPTASATHRRRPPATARAARPQAEGGRGDTYNIYPRTLDMTVGDLELLQRRQDARDRVGRPH